MVATNSTSSHSGGALIENRIADIDGLIAHLKERHHMVRSRWAIYSWIRNKKFPNRGKVNNYEWQFDLHEVDLWLERNPP